MGLFDRIRTIVGYPSRPGLFDGVALRSPESALLEAATFLGVPVTSQPVNVQSALRVPPIARAVQLYTSVSAQLVLRASVDSDATRWLSWSDGAVSPALRNALTIQDLIFHGHACMAVTRDGDGLVTNGIHLPVEKWRINTDTAAIEVHSSVWANDGGPGEWVTVDQSQVLYIPGLMPAGLLTMAQDTIRHYLSLSQTIVDRAANPTPLIALTVKDDQIYDPEELDAAQKSWHKARTSPNGAVGIVPAGIGIETPGADRDDASMLTDARNAVRLDAANFCNINAAMLDGNSGTSDTYSNTLQNRNEFLSLSVSLPVRALEARLSQNDVTADGVAVSFDTSAFDTLPDGAGNTGSAVGPAQIGTPANA